MSKQITQLYLHCRWRQGPDYPVELEFPDSIAKGPSLPYGYYTFLALGGEKPLYDVAKEIYMYDPDVEAWIEQEQILHRHSTVAMFVPEVSLSVLIHFKILRTNNQNNTDSIRLM